jgi:hypothetical protein
MRYVTLVLVSAAAVGAAIAACGSPLGLPPSFILNRTDTVSLYALSGTPISQPSAYSIAARRVVRTEQSSPFDFAFDIDTAGRALLLPTGALKLGQQSGLQISAQDFDSVNVAPTVNYKLDSALVVHQNSVVIAHSSLVTCSYGIPSYYYAKLHVLAVDTMSGSNGRRIDLVILTDINCGYRGLKPGLPAY